MAKPARPSLMSLTSQANAKSEAVVGVSSTEIHQGPVLDASSGRAPWRSGPLGQS